MKEESVPLDPDFKKWVIKRLSDKEVAGICKNASDNPQEAVKAMHSLLLMLRIEYRRETLANAVVNPFSHPQEMLDTLCALS